MSRYEALLIKKHHNHLSSLGKYELWLIEQKIIEETMSE